MCKIDGCEGEVACRGMCNAHYLRWRRSQKHMGPRCTVEGCAEQRKSAGLCARHHAAKWREEGTGRVCSVEGCGLPEYTRKSELCFPHYKRVRSGTPLHYPIGQVPPPRRDPVERFWEKVNKDGPVPEYRPDLGPCWLWTAAIGHVHGYGRFTLSRSGGHVFAHRFAYELLVGPIPEDLELDHLCRNRACCNPAHLEPVTHRENMRRGHEARRLQAVA